MAPCRMDPAGRHSYRRESGGWLNVGEGRQKAVQAGDEGGGIVDAGAEGEDRLIEQDMGPVGDARVIVLAVEALDQRVPRVEFQHRLAWQSGAAQPLRQVDVDFGLV